MNERSGSPSVEGSYADEAGAGEAAALVSSVFESEGDEDDPTLRPNSVYMKNLEMRVKSRAAVRIQAAVRGFAARRWLEAKRRERRRSEARAFLRSDRPEKLRGLVSPLPERSRPRSRKQRGKQQQQQQQQQQQRKVGDELTNHDTFPGDVTMQQMHVDGHTTQSRQNMHAFRSGVLAAGDRGGVGGATVGAVDKEAARRAKERRRKEKTGAGGGGGGGGTANANASLKRRLRLPAISGRGGRHSGDDAGAFDDAGATPSFSLPSLH
eukprot:CAMPEP_0170144638 /NCGR_PEP_ID=MMETSP0033_2-20121228/15004_1 /TAXON_ID=195969 /ORGANISM="Dolichomastix tenuilepis, Strain CCMP3274" /LENGTH=266 /DNA_ID=CAMNT_0010381153 /DNA_START=538 /DNA_END=1338 /DNA_ORIENTATION=+